MRNPFDLDEIVNIECSRFQSAALAALNARLSALDEQALKFDPDPQYRADLRRRLTAPTEDMREAA